MSDVERSQNEIAQDIHGMSETEATPERTYCPNCGEVDGETRPTPDGPECQCGWLVEELVLLRDLRGAVALADAAEEFLREMDALENPRPAGSWFALSAALGAFRETRREQMG